MKQISFLFPLAIIIGLFSCGEEEVKMPKPRGYFRLDIPVSSYQAYTGDCPFSFELPVYSKMVMDTGRNSEKCWANIEFPSMRGKIHLTYRPIIRNLDTITMDARSLAYKHSVKAKAIDEYLISMPEKAVYGMVYEIGGDAASSIQFYVTDSTRHFLRGSLYFSASPNSDSLSPVLKRVREDIEHLIKTFQWKNSTN